MRSSQRSGVIAFAVLASLLTTGTVMGEASVANAATYPSWQDVQNARANKVAKAAQIGKIKIALTGLRATVETTGAIALQKGDEAQRAQQKSDEGAQKAVLLQTQADAADDQATKSQNEAGQLAARFARSGGSSEISAVLFLNGSEASDLLSQLGLATVVHNRSAGVYEKAVEDKNSAQSLTDQAAVQRDALKALSDAAAKSLEAAAAAAQAAAGALEELQGHEAQLEAQLATLVTDVQHTEAEYKAGIKALWGASAGLGAGEISATGWARPSGGRITSSYGFRIDPVNGDYALHQGVDLGGNCGSPIFAANSGRVAYAGPYGGYGNYIKIVSDDGKMIGTGYGHIINGGILVKTGDDVGVGQNIAKVGSTGKSTGCHLHFEVYQNGNTRDPVSYLRGQGIDLAK